MRNALVAVAVLGVAFAGTHAIRAQAPAAASFEVASVKEAVTDPGNPISMIPRLMPPINGRFTATSAPLRVLVRVAYGVQDFQIVGGPSWQMSKRFDIQAKAEEGTLRDLMALRPPLQQLLAERFALKTHMEKREMPISALVVARADGQLGPALKHSTSDCSNTDAAMQKMAEDYAKNGPAALMAQMQGNPKCTMLPMMPTGRGGPMQFGMRGNGQPLSQLTALLTQSLGHMVQDRTGLTGLYDFELTFDPQVLMTAVSQLGVTLPANAMPQSDSPSLLTAIQEQLGLKLVNERGQVDVLVIDSAELPTPD